MPGADDHDSTPDPLGETAAVVPSDQDTMMATGLESRGPRTPAGKLPDRVGRFAVDGRLGAGGMGVVYRGRDPDLDREVAIKVLHDGTGAPDRLLREAQALARLTHENVVQVYEVGTSDDHVFVAMQLVKGQTLTRWVAEGERDWRAVVDMFARAGAGLVAAHGVGIVHRDFKPDNVLVGEDGVPRVLDFGLARGREEPGENEPEHGRSRPVTFDPAASTSLLEAHLTRTGSIMGTPAYMSPEQAAGQEAGPPSDQFSFCVALYEALYGRRPFAGGSLPELVANLEAGNVLEPPTDTDVPPWLHAALLRGLSRAPSDRFESMEALLAELTSYRTTSLQVGSQARASFLLASLFVLLAALGGNVVAARFFDVALTPRSTLPGTVVAFVVLLLALFALRRELTRSGLNHQIFMCFVSYLFYGPAVRLSAWQMDLTLEQMLPFEVIGGSLAAYMFSVAFDPRLRLAAVAFGAVGLVILAAPAAALELHAIAHLVFFGYMFLVWYRDGMPDAPGPVQD